MPSSTDNPQESFRILHSYLESALPNSQLTVEAIDSDHQPVLLLRTSHALAAFAVSNGEIARSFEILYGAFKTFYGRQEGKWDELDLAFVFCVPSTAANLDRFCSKVETDVYFCRKFVVPLTEPLAVSLARLPFLPLTPLNGRSLRPPSAQTFLRECRVPATLAKYVVVQHTHSPERIVEDCISGEFGEPQELTSTGNLSAMQPDRSSDSVLLQAITIKNFRAYRAPQPIEFGSAVTLLYGPNGFGKTSVFDALDFAATGEIGRIRASGEARFRNLARHLDGKSEASTVSITFSRNGAVRTITRDVDDRKQAILDGRTADRKTILTELTGGDMPASDRVDNFVSLFQATHLFNQERPELTKDFQDDCRLPSEIVARMLAFEDYANAVSKAAKVCALLQASIANANDEVRELSEKIDEEKKELERLGRTAESHRNVGALDAEVDSLRSELVHTGIVVGPEKADGAIVRGWRATVEARFAESESRYRQISNLIGEAAAMPRTRVEFAALQKQLTENEGTLATVDKTRNALELESRATDQQFAESKSKHAETQTRLDAIEWLSTNKPIYLQLVDRQRIITEEANVATQALNELQSSEQQATELLRSQSALVTPVAEQLKNKRAEMALQKNLIGSFAAWRLSSARLNTVVQSEEAALNALELLRAEARSLASAVATLNAEESRISRQVALDDSSQAELKGLLSKLLVHVSSGVCPLCGEDHVSKDELLQRIRNQVAADVASGALADLNAVREKIKGVAQEVAENDQKRQAVELQLGELKAERVRLTFEIAQYTDVAAKVGIAPEALSEVSVAQLEERLKQDQEMIEQLDQQVKSNANAVDAATKQLTNIRMLVETNFATTTELKTELAKIVKEVRRLRDDPKMVQLSFDVSDQRLLEMERVIREQLSSLKAEMASEETKTAAQSSQLSALRQESASLKTKLTSIRLQLTNLQNKEAHFAASLDELNLRADSDEETLRSLTTEESRTRAHLLALRDSASNLEMAFDAATTSAALTQLLQNVRIKENSIEALRRRCETIRPWLKYFEQLSRLVSAQQNDAIANFTREYGPRTSVIQRRLRSVYGFDEIEINNRDSSIMVRVKRHGEELRPTDYFSQSQQQTLFLGLFLTACISQTWSNFAPVFMDDPVTHFDDLNTYAFLDLIVGLLESNAGRQQFVLSTCDEKLLELARQKFRHLDKAAKFYRFSAIGPDGPVIEKIGMA